MPSPALATVDDLARVGAPASALTAFSAEQQEAALQAAVDEALAELNRRYVMPLTSWGADLTLRVAQIAVYELLSGAGAFDSADEGSSYRRRAEAARAWLKRVGDGTLDPPGIVDDTDDEELREGGPVVITDARRNW